jgi:nicotinate-nucleotide adenylyltransferase
MLALATNDDPKIKISTIELDAPEKPYTFETQVKLKNYYGDSAEIFFVMGADSWAEITTWREWEKVLTQTNIIVVTRPDYEIGFSHITGKIRERIVDFRGKVPGSKFKDQSSILGFVTENLRLPEKISSKKKTETWNFEPGTKIFITDAVQIDVSATEIKRKIKENETDWHELVPKEVANYVEKYNLYI